MRARLITAMAAAGIAGGLGAMVLVRLAPDRGHGDDGKAALAAPGAAIVAVAVPADLSAQAQAGKRVFDARCAACHGENAAGRDGAGPPLVHGYYEPDHHADAAFALAVRNGVRAHHWRFGNMPPVDGVMAEDLAAIVRYVRELQAENGIF